MPPELTDYIAAHYVEARGQEAAELGERGAYITPRTLMSILRLSQARHIRAAAAVIAVTVGAGGRTQLGLGGWRLRIGI